MTIARLPSDHCHGPVIDFLELFGLSEPVENLRFKAIKIKNQWLDSGLAFDLEGFSEG